MIWFFVIMYCAALTIMSLVAMGKTSWLYASTEQTVEFRKPDAWRICAGMAAGFFLVSGLALPIEQVDRWNDYTDFYVYTPLCLTVAALLAFASGPQDVCIDVKARAGYGTFGAPFFHRRQDFRLLETSFLCVCPGANSYTAYLCIADPAPTKASKRRFLLGNFSSQDRALGLLNDLGSKLQLPVKKLTLKEMYDLEMCGLSETKHKTMT